MIPLETIRDAVCEEYGIDRLTFEARRRAVKIVIPRHMAWWLANELTPNSYCEIGRYLGNVDHTTVMSGARKHERRMLDSPELRNRTNRLLERLKDKANPDFEFVRPGLSERVPGMAFAPSKVRVGDFVDACRAAGKRIEVVDAADPPYWELMLCWRRSGPEGPQ